jgi:hypothetical protein
MTDGVINVTYLNTVVPEAIEWYWRGRLAKRKLTVWDGMPGMGKTTVGLDLVARFTRGDPLPGESIPTPKTRVGFLSDEDGLADTTVPRLEIAGADLGMVCQMTGTALHGGVRSLLLPDDLPVIAQIIREQELGLLYIDPLAAHAGRGVNLYIDQDVRTQITSPLAHLAAETGVTIVLVRHPTKAQLGPAMLRGGGSIGIIGAARFGLMFGHNPYHEDERVLASTKCNIGPMPQSLIFKLIGVPGSDHAKVWWSPFPSDLTAEDLLPIPAKPSAKKMNEAEEWLASFLDREPKPALEILAAGDKQNHSERTLKRAKSALQITSHKTNFADSVWYWCLPGQVVGQQYEGLRPEASAEQAGFGWSANGHGDRTQGDRWTG